MRVLLCDIGNVVLGFDNDRAKQQLLELADPGVRLNGSARTQLVSATNGEVWRAYGSGRISDADYRKFIRKILRCNSNVTDDDIDEAVSDVFTTIPDTIDILKRLRASSVILVAVSNAEPPRVRYAHRLGIWSLFDRRVASCEVGLCKPDAEIFLYALGLVEATPDQALFVDDVPEYVAAAQLIDIKAHCFENPAGLEGFLVEHEYLSA
jgi:HAD superfamily hydrolase (TIGR01509 family)